MSIDILYFDRGIFLTGYGAVRDKMDFWCCEYIFVSDRMKLAACLIKYIPD